MNKKFKKRFRKDFVMFYAGIAIYIFFLVLWFLTLPPSEEPKVNDPINWDELSVSEQIKAVEKSEQNIMDESNYLMAKATNNNIHCENINDSVLKAKCFKEVTYFEELVPDTSTEGDIMDESNYLMATMMSDISFCQFIINPDLKSACLAELS
jgi:hypothetical protein